ncbi:MAG: Phosphoglycerate mutase [Paenibacillaceae bacterium]|nr:Phosphoglycerate mutase [Paenibacillaceae bacterium]
MRKIVVIQHCQSEHHINNMTGGWTDTPLTELGRKQAELLGEKLKSVLKDNDDGEKFTLYSSDLLRAKQTADIVGARIGLPAAYDRELREVNLGVANGQTKAWAHKHRIPRPSAGFDIDYREYLHAESWRQFYDRVCRCLERICAADPNHLIIVTHGGTLGYIIAWWLGLTPEMLEKAYFPTLPGSYSLLHSNGYNQRTLRQLNDTAHLDPLKQEQQAAKTQKKNGGGAGSTSNASNASNTDANFVYDLVLPTHGQHFAELRAKFNRGGRAAQRVAVRERSQDDHPGECGADVGRGNDGERSIRAENIPEAGVDRRLSSTLRPAGDGDTGGSLASRLSQLQQTYVYDPS